MAASVTYINHYEDTGGAQTYTFTTKGIGTAASDRIVVIVAGKRGGTDVTTPTCTIAGVSATLEKNVSLNTTGLAIFSLLVTSGTTATIVIDWTASTGRCGIDIFNVNGAATTSFDTGSASVSDAFATISMTDLNFDNNSAGVMAVNWSFGTSATTTWGLGTKESDREVDTGLTHISAADLLEASATTPTITATYSENATVRVMAGVTFSAAAAGATNLMPQIWM